ncbi:MAG: hypothetical protein Q8N61_02755 [bacterium]|nr:hypothetical protein [bacterium]
MKAKVKMVEHLIDCDADPFMPSGWMVESHQKGGQFDFDPAKIKLYLSPNQQSGKVVMGNKLRKELANEPVLNANVLSYLLAHPELIPEDWKKDERGSIRCIFFWGTIYRRSFDYLCVRYLYFNVVGRWHWDFHWLNHGWSDYYPAALRAS